MPTPQQAHSMTSHYAKLWKAKYGREPNVNRHSARWGFDNILRGLSTEEVKELLAYYFTTPGVKQHDLEWFFYNYHTLLDNMRSHKKDVEDIKALLAASQKRADEWRNAHDKGTGSH